VLALYQRGRELSGISVEDNLKQMQDAKKAAKSAFGMF